MFIVILVFVYWLFQQELGSFPCSYVFVSASFLIRSRFGTAYERAKYIIPIQQIPRQYQQVLCSASIGNSGNTVFGESLLVHAIEWIPLVAVTLVKDVCISEISILCVIHRWWIYHPMNLSNFIRTEMFVQMKK